jgi:surface protein
MSSIVEKLNEINDIKNNIKQAIRDKGVDVVDGTPFAEYPNCIRNISGGNSYYEELYNKRTNNGYTLDGLFAYSRGEETLDLTGLDFSRVQSAQGMFYKCNSRINIGQCNTSNLEQAPVMFQYFTNGGAYIDLSVFDFSNVMFAQGMFSGCNLDNIDIRNINLNLSKTRNRFGMFDNCTGTLDLSNWSIDGLTELTEFFMNCKCSKINLTNWATTNITWMNYMFTQCSSLQELIIPSWDMTNAQGYMGMFNNCNNLRYVDVHNCNDNTASKIIEQLPMKSEANYGEIELPEGSSQNIINFAMNKYWKPTSLEATPVTSGDVSVVGINQIMVGEKTSIVLSNCSPWYGTKDNIVFVSSNTDAVVIEGNKAKAVGEGEAQITAIDSTTQATISNNPATITVTLTDANPGLIMFKSSTPNLQNYSYGVMRVNNVDYRTNQLSLIDGIYRLNVGEPITQFKFYQDSNVTEVVKLNVSKVTNMNDMFYKCTSLREIDANNWVTPSVTAAYAMFGFCPNLEIADISNWDTSGMKSTDAFYGSNNLHTLRMDNCSRTTISMITGTGDFPNGTIEGVTRTIYCKESNAAGLTAPNGWVFSYVD